MSSPYTLTSTIMVLLLLAMLGPSAYALSDMVEVPPGPQDNPIRLEAQSKRLPNGAVEFVIIISENRSRHGQLPERYKASLGTMKVTERPDGYSEESRGIRELPTDMVDHTIVCKLTVSAKELKEPNLAFFFTIPDSHGMAFTAYYLRLKKFLNP